MEVIVSILSGALASSVLGAVSSKLDRGTFTNSVIGALGGGLLGASIFVQPMRSIVSQASDNEVFVMLLILGVLGAGLMSVAIGRAMSSLAE